MSTTVTPPPKKVNRIGLEVLSYKGAKTTLCAGCGHNAISERIVECFYELGVEPWNVAKFSGIGCSSKSPAYFLGLSHGFNAVHGRMPSVATGAMLANRTMLGIGVTGDGDTASIGIGQFMHLLRRNLPLIYIIEDNGVYGLTKGQFSATADLGSKLKTGVINDLPPFDCCALALQWGATFVARSFSGDKKQLAGDSEGRDRAQRAFRHRRGLALHHVQRSRRLHQELQLHEGARRDAARAGFRAVLRRHFGRDSPRARCRRSRCTTARRCASRSWAANTIRPTSSTRSRRWTRPEKKGEVLTGVFYVDTRKPNFMEMLNMDEAPLATLPESKIRPPKELLDQVMEELR